MTSTPATEFHQHHMLRTLSVVWREGAEPVLYTLSQGAETHIGTGSSWFSVNLLDEYGFCALVHVHGEPEPGAPRPRWTLFRNGKCGRLQSTWSGRELWVYSPLFLMNREDIEDLLTFDRFFEELSGDDSVLDSGKPVDDQLLTLEALERFKAAISAVLYDVADKSFQPLTGDQRQALCKRVREGQLVLLDPEASPAHHRQAAVNLSAACFIIWSSTTVGERHGRQI